MSANNSINSVGTKPAKIKKFGKMVSIAHIPELKEKYKTDEVPMNDRGELISNTDDEFDLPIDEEGEKKIDADGNLLGGREYKFRTFTLNTRSNKNKRYALAADMSKILDYKRGALLFINHKYTIFKCHLTDEEKSMLQKETTILNNITSLNMHKAVLIVPARSLFREFGYKCIKNGVPGQDDYYVNIVPYPEYPESISTVNSSKIYQYLKPYVKDPSVDVFPPNKSHDSSVYSTQNYLVQQQQLMIQQQRQKQQLQPIYHEGVNKNSGTNLSQSPSVSNLARQTEQFYTRSGSNVKDQFDSTPIATNNTNGNFGSVMRSQLLYNPEVKFIRENNSRRIVDMFDMMQSNLNISLNAKMTKENWIFMHADACSRLNYDLYESRERWQFIKNRGVRDPYTNGFHVPKFTQPTKIISRNKVVKNNSNSNNKKKSGVDIELFLKDDDFYKVKTGLKDLPGLENLKKLIKDKDVLDAIDDQVEYETNN